MWWAMGARLELLLRPELSRYRDYESRSRSIDRSKMNCCFSSFVLYSVSILLWIVLTISPTIPQIPVVVHYPNNGTASLGLVELLSLPFMICVCISLYCLFLSANRWKNVSFITNILILISILMVSTGMGMHSVCVILENHPLPADNKPLVDSVHFLHEYMSHWMFMIGFYSTMLLTSYMEHNNIMKEDQASLISKNHILYSWVINGVFGSFLAKFSHETNTGIPTAVFFVIIIYQNYKRFGQLVFTSCQSNNIINASLSIAGIVGLPALLYIETTSHD